MLGRYTLANNVRVTLAADVSAVASSITVNAASGIFNNPPDPTGDAASGGLSIATIQDAALPPTKTEIITYTGVTDNGNGTLTLTGVLRGVEGSTARAWNTNDVLFQSATAGQFSDVDIVMERSGTGKIILGVANVALPKTTTTIAPTIDSGRLFLSGGKSNGGASPTFNGASLQLFGDDFANNVPAGKGGGFFGAKGSITIYSGLSIAIQCSESLLFTTATAAKFDMPIVMTEGSGSVLRYGADQVVAAPRIGWSASTGTAARGSFATYAAPTISATYSQAQAQAMADHIQVLSRQVKALKDDLMAHGLIKP